MRFTLDSAGEANVIRSYSEGWIMVNRERIGHSVLITPASLNDWPPADFAALEESHFERIARLQPELVLLGTGPRQRFPEPRLTRSLARVRIGLEVMDTSAACRTYNILMTEGRGVLAALLMI